MYPKERTQTTVKHWLPFYLVPSNNRRPACLWNGPETEGSPRSAKARIPDIGPRAVSTLPAQIPARSERDGMGHHNQDN
jgi:hypothetical protein